MFLGETVFPILGGRLLKTAEDLLPPRWEQFPILGGRLLKGMVFGSI